MRLLLLAALVAALPFATARAQDAAPPAPIEILADAKAASGDVVDVDIQSMSFATPEVKIKAGQTVRWTNKEEGAAHNVHFRNGPAKTFAKARGPMLNLNEAYAVTFVQPGTYDYICTPHSAMMKGKVIVE